MDPALLISGVSALLKAIDTWVRFRDSRRASEALRTERADSLRSPQTIIEARVVASIVPQNILDLMINRAENCFEKYAEILSDPDYLPQEVDDATKAVKACVCRELRRMRTLGEPVPNGRLLEYWRLYCEKETA